MAFANANRPNGFDPGRQGGKTAAVEVARPVAASRSVVGAAASADLAIGDAYGLDANGNAYHVGADGNVRGIVRGFRWAASPAVMGGAGPVSIDYLPAANAGTILGIEDPSTEFEVQTDTCAASNIGGLFNMTDAAPDSTLRQARSSLNVGGGAGTQFRITRLVDRPTDNAFGTFARVYVRLNQALMA